MITIICAAIYFEDGEVYVHQPKNIKSGFVICGRRHHNCYTVYAMTKNPKLSIKHTEGFLTSDNNFVNREEAVVIALNAGQIEEKKIRLFSEDLY